MRRITLLIAILTCFIFSANAQYKKDGSPDMRYSSNKQTYGNSYSNPSYNYGTNSNVRYQSGYIINNGTYVEPHNKTNSNALIGKTFQLRAITTHTMGKLVQGRKTTQMMLITMVVDNKYILDQKAVSITSTARATKHMFQKDEYKESRAV